MSFPRTSTIGVARQPKRPTSSRDSEKEQIWIPMLQSASKGKDLAEKQLIVLGGSPERQREFLEQLNPQEDQNRPRFNQQRRTGQVPLSNKYALGHTYHDVLDADQEDVLARLNIYLLSKPSGIFAPLLKSLFTPKTVKDTLITILLDWSEPFRWARQLRQWIRMLRKVILSLDEETKIEMEECMNAWKEKRAGPDSQAQSEEQKANGPTSSASSPGEWDEGLGIPLSVVCVQSERIETLEREQGWEEDHFDFLLQWIRTVLLKHGASLCYTATYDSNDIRTLLQTSLNIQSLLKRDVAKHNVIDRDKILVPPNWDSWGKIRILRDAFDAESVSERWSIEIQDPPDGTIDFDAKESEESSAVAVYESFIPRPPQDLTTPGQQPQSKPEITVTVPSLQDFLQTQKTVLDQNAVEDEAEKASRGSNTTEQRHASERSAMHRQRVADSIGTYSINVNGIDVDAEEATRKLREREQERTAAKRDRDNTPTRPKLDRDKESKQSTEEMSSFFANLMKKGPGARSGAGSGVSSPTPRRESPAPDKRRPVDGGSDS